MRVSPMISIVILSYSSKRKTCLRDLLDSIEKQTYRNIEILVIVERSAELKKLASEFPSGLTKIVYFTHERVGVSKARNLGVKLAKGEIVAFVDDDALPSPNWCEIIAKSFEGDPSIIGVTGRAIPLGEPVRLLSFPHSLYWAIGCTRPDDRAPHYTNFAAGVNMAFLKEAFTSHKFSLDIIGDERSRANIFKGLPNDENDFAVRVTTQTGRLILYNPVAVVYHHVDDVRLQFAFVRQYSFWQGVAEARYSGNARWSRARWNLLKTFVGTIGHDIFSFEGGINATTTRLKFVLSSLIFIMIGFFAHKCNLVYRIAPAVR